MEDIQSLFSADLTSVDISRPVLRSGPTAFVVAEAKVEPNKAGDKQMLVIQLKTRYDALSTKNEKINPGYPVTDRIVLTSSEGRPAERIMQDLKRFQLACGRSGPFGEPANYIGCNLTANVSVESDATGQYGDQNRVRYIAADKA